MSGAFVLFHSEQREVQTTLWDDDVCDLTTPIQKQTEKITIPVVMYPSKLNVSRAVRVIQTVREKTHTEIVLSGIEFHPQHVVLVLQVTLGTVRELKTSSGQTMHSADCLKFNAAFGQTVPEGSVANETLQRIIEGEPEGVDALTTFGNKINISSVSSAVNGGT
jgi:hypothetical protein